MRSRCLFLSKALPLLLRPPPTDVHTVEISFAVVPEGGSDELLARHRHDLNDDEVAKARRFAFDRDRALYVASHVFLRRTLAGCIHCEPREIDFVNGAHGRPELANRALRFNLSHTAGLAMIGVTASADIGVDVENIHRPVDAELIAPTVFTPAELAAADGSPESFFRSWTLKESYIKARGVGLSMDLQSFGFTGSEPARLVCDSSTDDPGTWQFATFAPTDRHRAAAAVRAKQVQWIVHDTASYSGEVVASTPAAVRRDLVSPARERWDGR